MSVKIAYKLGKLTESTVCWVHQASSPCVSRMQDLFTVQENTGASICVGEDLMKESSNY